MGDGWWWRWWRGRRLQIWKEKKKGMTVDTKLFADSDPLFSGTVLAYNITTPLESTMTPFCAFLPDRIVASSTAEWLAIVQFIAVLGTPTSGHSWIVNVCLGFAKVGRPFIKEEIRLAEATGKLPPCGAATPHRVAQVRLVYENGPFESLLKDGADPSEFRCRLPACLHLAAPAHAMALAAYFHVGAHHLCVCVCVCNKHHIIIRLQEWWIPLRKGKPRR